MTHINLHDYNGDDLAPILALPGVRSIAEALTDGTYIVAIVDYGAEADRLLRERNEIGLGHLHDTARYDVTFAFSNADDIACEAWPAEKCWHTVGWCWSHDHHTEGSPRVVAFLPDAKVADVHAGCGLMGY